MVDILSLDTVNSRLAQFNRTIRLILSLTTKVACFHPSQLIPLPHILSHLGCLLLILMDPLHLCVPQISIIQQCKRMPKPPGACKWATTLTYQIHFTMNFRTRTAIGLEEGVMDADEAVAMDEAEAVLLLQCLPLRTSLPISRM